VRCSWRGGTPHPHALQSSEVEGSGEGDILEIQRASVVRTNVRLTTHTVQSMLCGAGAGMDDAHGEPGERQGDAT